MSRQKVQTPISITDETPDLEDGSEKINPIQIAELISHLHFPASWSSFGIQGIMRVIITYLTILVAAILMVGCNSWDSKPGHYIQGANAMAGVSAFIATYGWNSSTNEEDVWRWEDFQPHYIKGLPWSKYKTQQFPALTHDGILYVLSNPGWHGDYGGVAYNPRTNNFPNIDGIGFKPIGGHWYVWCIPELSGGMNLPHVYE